MCKVAKTSDRSNQAPAPSESALSIGAIAGIAVGGFVFLVAAAGLGYCLHRRRANQIEIEERYFGTEKMKEEQFGGVTAFHRNSWREPDMDVLAGQKRSSMLVLPSGFWPRAQRWSRSDSVSNPTDYSNVSISNSKSAREF